MTDWHLHSVVFEPGVPLIQDTVDRLHPRGVRLVTRDGDFRTVLAEAMIPPEVIRVGVGDDSQRHVGEAPPVVFKKWPIHLGRCVSIPGIDDNRPGGPL